jgi:hypothetical protein
MDCDNAMGYGVGLAFSPGAFFSFSMLPAAFSPGAFFSFSMLPAAIMQEKAGNET